MFVLTHHPRQPLEMLGGTTFTFVTEGIEPALEQARAAAGEHDVLLGGGADAANQYLRAGLLDEFELHFAPVLLRDGARLFDDVGPLKLRQVRTIEAPGVTHVKYRIVR